MKWLKSGKIFDLIKKYKRILISASIAAALVCCAIAINIAISPQFSNIEDVDSRPNFESIFRSEIMNIQNVDLNNAIIIDSEPGIYIAEPFVPLESHVEPFDSSDKTWWERNTGVARGRAENDVLYAQNLFINRSGYEIIGKNLLKHNIDNLMIYVDYAEDVLIKDSYLQAGIYTYSNNRSTGNLILENSSFGKNDVDGTAVGGMAVKAMYNYVTSNNDGFNADGGNTMPSYIAYNWIDGPGHLIGDRHMDGIQFWREGNAEIYRNRIGGWDNSCIIIHCGLPPRIGSGPISNIKISENYLEGAACAWYYLFVCEYQPEETNEDLSRPRYITVTDNWFDDKSTYPIYSGKRQQDRAMFVRSEEERDEGVLRQEMNPQVLEYRKSLGYAPTAVDARTWIVWNNNRWVEDGSEVDPTEDGWRGGMKGWYDLAGERERYPSDVLLPGQSVIQIAFDESSANGNYPSWIVENKSTENIASFYKLPGSEEEKQMPLIPGKTIFRAKKIPGDNIMHLRWMQSGNEMKAESFGVNYKVQDLVVSLVEDQKDPTSIHWDVTNRNGFLLKGDWTVEGTEQSGVVWVGANSTTRVRAKVQAGKNIFRLTWANEYFEIKQVLADPLLSGQAENPAFDGQDFITVVFDESSKDGNYLTWIVTNHTGQNQTVYYIMPGDTEAKPMPVAPGDKLFRARKLPGDNIFHLRWVQNGEEKSLETPGTFYKILDLMASFVEAESNDKTVQWDVVNENGFLVKGEWQIVGTDLQGVVWAGANSTTRVRTPKQSDDDTLIVTWYDEYGRPVETMVSISETEKDGIPLGYSG